MNWNLRSELLKCHYLSETNLSLLFLITFYFVIAHQSFKQAAYNIYVCFTGYDFFL